MVLTKIVNITTIAPIFCLLLLGCQVDKAGTDNYPRQTGKPIDYYPESFFVVNRQLYFSDGKRFYCGFKNWEHLYELRGKRTQPKGIAQYNRLPRDMKFIKECNLGIVTNAFFE